MAKLQLRDDQVAVVDEIKTAFEEGCKVIALNASTGSGKSPILMSVVKQLRKTGYNTSPLRTLVNQYRDTIERFPESEFGWVVMGRGAYPCPHLIRNEKKRFSNLPDDEKAQTLWKHENRMKSMTADGAPCTDGGPHDGKFFVGNGEGTTGKKKQYVKECPMFSECRYYQDKNRAMTEDNAIMTLDYFLYSPAGDILNGNEWGWQPRDILVVDEAHFLSAKLVDFFSISISEKGFPGFNYKKVIDTIAEKKKSMKPSDNFSVLVVNTFNEEYDTYLKLQDEEMEYLKTFLEDGKEDGNHEPEDSNHEPMCSYLGKDMPVEEAMQKHKKFLYKLKFVRRNIRPDTEFVYYPTDTGFTLKPYTAKDYVQVLWNAFDHIILSSATLFDVPNYLEDLGLSKYKWKQIDVSAPFDPDNGPIFKATDLYLSMKNFDALIPKVVNEVDRIMEEHPNERGIIHCFSDRYRKAIWSATKNRNRMVVHDSFNRQEVLKEFTTNVKEGDNKVLLSVNMGEGVDLKDDLARFQIVVKCPFLPMGDPWVSLHKERSGKWYRNNATIELMQMAGRVVRSKEDFGSTYIIDAYAWDILQSGREEMKKHHPWFVARMDAGIRQKKAIRDSTRNALLNDILEN